MHSFENFRRSFFIKQNKLTVANSVNYGKWAGVFGQQDWDIKRWVGLSSLCPRPLSHGTEFSNLLPCDALSFFNNEESGKRLGFVELEKRVTNWHRRHRPRYIRTCWIINFAILPTTTYNATFGKYVQQVGIFESITSRHYKRVI